MATASSQGSLRSSSFERDSKLSSRLLPPSPSPSPSSSTTTATTSSSSSFFIVRPHRSVVTRVISVVGLLVSLLTVGMIMWLGRERQTTKIAFEERLANIERVAYYGGEPQHSRGKSAAETTTSVSLKPSTLRKPEMPECQAEYGAAKSDSVIYPGVIVVSSWIQSSGEPCKIAHGSELTISEAGNYIVICKAELSTFDHTGVVTSRIAKGSTVHYLKAQLALRVQFGDTKMLLKNDTRVVLHHLTYQLNTIVWLPADARLAVLLTSLAGLETNLNLRWHDVTIARVRLGGASPLR